MNRKLLTLSSVISFTLAAAAGAAYAQRGRVVHPPDQNGTRVICIPVNEAEHMMQQMRVWLFTPPPGASQYGIGGLGEGHRIWALLPSCTEPNPDDPRDPCPIQHIEIQLITGTGEIHQTEPQMVSAETTRRVQSLVVPESIQTVRIKLVRRDNSVRYEAAVDVAQLHNLPAPEGSPTAQGFGFELSSYPSR
jgi:hypothetical protein